MASLFDGTDQLICDALGIEERQHLGRKRQKLTPLADKAAFLLVHLSDRTLRLVELKWTSDTPALALFEVLEYGLAYLLARLQRCELALEARRFLQDSIRDVRLEVVGPNAFYAGNHRSDLFQQMHNAVARFADSRTNGQWTMSLQPLAFPDSFDAVPFASGEAVKRTCARRTPSPEGRMVREAFAQLVPLSPSPRA